MELYTKGFSRKMILIYMCPINFVGLPASWCKVTPISTQGEWPNRWVPHYHSTQKGSYWCSGNLLWMDPKILFVTVFMVTGIDTNSKKIHAVPAMRSSVQCKTSLQTIQVWTDVSLPSIWVEQSVGYGEDQTLGRRATQLSPRRTSFSDRGTNWMQSSQGQEICSSEEPQSAW